MFKNIKIFMLLLLSVLFFGCADEELEAVVSARGDDTPPITYSVTVKVSDDINGASISNAQVVLAGKTKITNALGAASFELAKASYSLSIAATGYKSYTHVFDLTADNQQVLAAMAETLPVPEVSYLFHSENEDSNFMQYWGDNWGSGATITNIDDDPDFIKVLKVSSGTNWGNKGAVAWGNEDQNAINISTYTHVKFKVKATNLTDVEVIVNSATKVESNIGYLINNGTLLENGWVEITAVLPDFSDMTWFALAFNGEQSGLVLLADVHFVTQTMIIQGPHEAAALPPQLSDAQAIVLYSDSLKQDKYISVWSSNWWNAPIYSQGNIDGNYYAKYEITELGTVGGAVGLEFGIENGFVDASAKTMMNFDMYVESGITQIQLKLVSDGGDSLYKTINPPTGEWVSHQAVFSELEVLSGTLEPSTLKLAGFIVFGEAGKSFYVDNIYFSGESIFSDLVVTVEDNNNVVIAGAIVSIGDLSVTADANGVATLNLQEGEHSVKVSADGFGLRQQIQSNVGGGAITLTMQPLNPGPFLPAPAPIHSDAEAFVLYSDSLLVDKNISFWEDNWYNAPVYSQVNLAGNNMAKFQITPDGRDGGVVGIQYGVEGGVVDASNKIGMRFDIYATSGVTQAVIQIVASNGARIQTIKPVTTGEWVSLELVFDDLVDSNQSFSSEELTQLGLQLWGTSSDSVYLDNIYFY
ncbi:hypothetical protein Ping_0559 [Psychromonas ingrahamii 37]|uniref:Carboxypeptidase regulatory-like domain-containing protein n=1 Tax=Psychromonas ingrahamii (strain DSM 17664 / CCUG 51855 / 37) TaxID=357804 RepID=A1SSE8_PSYIN|nr:carboxypeptidase-like regulatory domain-containing protein [Psychromonas ingrahamii]ABM02413.1 hypothetical protein Ping_0559 [Psychromonas ingrahamii 37]